MSTPPLRRHRSGRIIAGVSGGIAGHLNVPVLWVRLVFALLAGLGGAGLVAYALLWAFVPPADSTVDGAADGPADGAAAGPATVREQQQAVGLVALGIGLALAGSALLSPWAGWLTGPLGVALVGAILVWREADAAQRIRWRNGAGAVFGAGGRMALLRVLAGSGLVASGIAVFVLNQGELGQLRFALLAVLATLVGVAVLTVPWWLRMMRALDDERWARIRTEERAEIAAHLHDSVLQTLALIQQQPESGREVRRLARGQERELRSWLYGPRGYGSPAEGNGQAPGGQAPDGQAPDGQAPGGSFATALHAVAAEVEDTYAVRVQVVVVGDTELDEALPALVQAGREAMVNAAKHSGAGELSVYAEVEPD